MADAPDPRLAEQFQLLEQRIEAVLGVVRTVKQENARLAAELATLRERNDQALSRIDALLDRIDAPE
jgi:hypothetical protein